MAVMGEWVSHRVVAWKGLLLSFAFSKESTSFPLSICFWPNLRRLSLNRGVKKYRNDCDWLIQQFRFVPPGLMLHRMPFFFPCNCRWWFWMRLPSAQSPEGSFPAEEVRNVNFSRWCEMSVKTNKMPEVHVHVKAYTPPSPVNNINSIAVRIPQTIQ